MKFRLRLIYKYQWGEYHRHTWCDQSRCMVPSPLQSDLMTSGDNIGKIQRDHEQHPMPLESRI